MPYLQHGRDWSVTRDAITRLAARLGHAFTYGELAAEIEEHDGVKIDGRGYAGALEALARNIGSSDPLWTAMVVAGETGEPGDGFWHSADDRCVNASRLSPEGRAAWLAAQQAWCVAAARVSESQLDQALRDVETEARESAQDAYIELLLEDQRRDQRGGQ